MSDKTTCDHDWEETKVWTSGPSIIRICKKCSVKESITRIK